MYIAKEGSIEQHCMNCGIGMYGKLCGAQWGDIKRYDNIIISCQSQRGLGNVGSETAVTFTKYMKACRLLNVRKKQGIIGQKMAMYIANWSRSPLFHDCCREAWFALVSQVFTCANGEFSLIFFQYQSLLYTHIVGHWYVPYRL